MKQCFVIMPYGGADPEKQRHFAGVYHSIIAPAVRMAGYEPKRSDIEGQPGNITQDIIRDLCGSDMVIADLTNANPNVFFELGIRHAFRKSGTVHVIDVANSLPFDVSQYRAIEYTIDLADIPGVMAKIVEAMKRREEQPGRPDNPVHDAIPQLPINIAAAGDDALREQLRDARETGERLRHENDKLTARLADLHADNGAGDGPELDVDVLLNRADEIVKSTGQHAILKLRKAIETGGADALAKELRGVLRSPYLEENDFMEIFVLCKQAGLDDHRRAACEVARRRYLHSSKVLLALVDALDDSPNQADQERGRIMLEERLGIVHNEKGLPAFSGALTSLPLHESVGLVFNFYTSAGRPEWTLALTEGLPLSLQNDPMIARNRARCFAELNKGEEAAKEYERALGLDPFDDQTLAWYADFLDDQGKSAEAYAMFEKAIVADPDDGALFLHLGVHVLNRGFYRAKSGKIEGPLARKMRPKVAVPILLRATEVGRQSSNLLERVVRVLVRGDAVYEADCIASGTRPEGKYDDSPVIYLVSRIAEKMKIEEGDGSQNSLPN